MNLLAHALLSPPESPQVLVGNLTADWIKGRVRLTLSEDLQRGISLHRQIDTFTDVHPVVIGCAELLAPRWGRYSAVLVDIFFDHVLAARWQEYSAVPREDFIAATYATLRAHLHTLPQRAQYAANALLADDWFSCYATLDGIALTLARLSTRLQHGVELAPAVDDFVRHRAAFDEAFGVFFPQLMRHAGAKVREK